MKNNVLNDFKPPLGIEIINMRGSKKKLSCITKPKSLKEIADIVNTNEETVLFIHKDGCPHCEETAPILDNICKTTRDNGVPINFIECSVEDNHCRELAQKMKVTGVPLTIGMKKGGNPMTPSWRVEGARVDELKKHINADASRLASGSGQPRPQQQVPQMPQQMPQQPRRDGVNDFVTDFLGRSLPTSNSPMGQASFNAPMKNIPTLCTPNVDCNEDEFNSKFVDFMSDMW